MTIRFVAPGDCPALLSIYARYIDTSITFECALPAEAEFAGRITAIERDYPYLVCEDEGEIVGYAYAHRHMERAAYQWNAELSVYLDPSRTGRGLGKRFYRVLMELLRLQRIRTVVGVVTVPNEKSEALHRTMGFQIAGTFRNAGYKNGRWRDVMWFTRAIAPHNADPAPFIPIGDLPRTELERILSTPA